MAEYYATTPHLQDLCFVFPNRRSGKFFEQRIAEAVPGPVMLPRIMPMADFLSDITAYNQVGQLESIIVLYKAYCQVMGDKAAPMDSFVFWANLIINDFNDADMNLVDVAKLYANLRDLRQIATSYLDRELIDDIERVLNINLPRDIDTERFWRAWYPQQAASGSTDGDAEVRQAYFSLWERLYDIYQVYHDMLKQQGLHTVGRIYRDAVECIKQMDDQRLPDKVVMVGFSSLSVSEMAIFKALRGRQRADFWWDNALTGLEGGSNNPVGKAVSEYAALFPMPRQLEAETLTGLKVEAIAVPSTVGQAKLAFEWVDRLIKQGDIPHTDNAVNTAIVLPNENMLIHLMGAVSQQITALNVTMGYSMRNANIVSLMHLVARAHKRASKRAGGWTYYREDVCDIMSHPIIKTVFTQQAMSMTDTITAKNLWNIDESQLASKGFGALFQTVTDTADIHQVCDYIDRLTEFCDQVVGRLKLDQQPLLATGDDDDTRKLLPLQAAFVTIYAEALHQVKAAFVTHGIPATGDTLFYLIDRLTSAYVVPFEGEPIRGLQIMGMQETRSLDFDNLIILSMNEREYPRKHAIASFIPDDIRAAFFMLTSARQDDIEAYNFYRLISRAKNVALLYSNSSSGVGSADPSRFVTQLKLLYGGKVEFTEYRAEISVNMPAELPIAVGKVGAPMNDYVKPSAEDDPENAKCLSHSSLAEYIDCPLKFYMHHVQHLDDNNQAGDFMDAGTLGTIVHDTLQKLYSGDKKIITYQDIEDFKKHEMANVMAEKINLLFMHRSGDVPLEGQAVFVQKAIETYVLRVLNYDQELLSQQQADHFEIIECEQDHRVQLQFDDVKFNFTYKPDRVDRIGDSQVVRMVDYKTGKDETRFADLDELFRPSTGNFKRRKAVMQLMLYCNAWHHEHPQQEVIMPVIYKLVKMSETGVRKGEKVGKRLVYNPFLFEAGSELNKAFVTRTAAVIRELLDPATPFTQAQPDSHCCTYCHFADFCQR